MDPMDFGGERLRVDDETYNDVTKDMSTLQQYAKLVYEQTLQENIDLNEGNEINMDIPTMSCEPDVLSPSIVENKLASNSLSNSSTSNSETFRWNDKLIRCLITLRLGKEAEFSNPVCKKIKLWKEIATELTKITGGYVTGEMCDTKFRNLLCTYRINKKKQSTTGEGAIKWEYFQIMDEVLGCKASSLAPSQNIGDTLDENLTDNISTNTTEIDSESESGSTNHGGKTSVEKCKKRKCGMSLQAYLWEKLKREERKEKESNLKEEEKVKRKREMWEEKKALKEKEVNAILALAKAITETKK